MLKNKIFVLLLCFISCSIGLNASDAHENIIEINEISTKNHLQNTIPKLKYHDTTIQQKVKFFYEELKPLCSYHPDFDPNSPSHTKKERFSFKISGFDAINKYQASLLGYWLTPLINLDSKKEKFIFDGIKKLEKNMTKYKDTKKEFFLFYTTILEIVQHCSIKIRNMRMKKRSNNKLIIPIKHFENIIDLYEINKLNIKVIKNRLFNFKKTKNITKQQQEIIQKLSQNKIEFKDNLKDIGDYRDVEKRRNFTNILANKTNDLICALEESQKSIDLPVSPRKNIPQEPFFIPHPNTQEQKNLKGYHNLAKLQDEEVIKMKKKKEKHKEERKEKHEEYERKQKEITYYNQLVEEEKEKARRARQIDEEDMDMKKPTRKPSYPDFLTNYSDVSKFDRIMNMIYSSKNHGELLKAILKNPGDYRFESLKGTDYYSMRHNDGLRYVIWQDKDGLKAILCKHYKGL